MLISRAHDLQCRLIGHAHTCETRARAGLGMGGMDDGRGEMEARTQGGEGWGEKGRDGRVRAARHLW